MLYYQTPKWVMKGHGAIIFDDLMKPLRLYHVTPAKYTNKMELYWIDHLGKDRRIKMYYEYRLIPLTPLTALLFPRKNDD